jgi:hypothetical protein
VRRKCLGEYGSARPVQGAHQVSNGQHVVCYSRRVGNEGRMNPTPRWLPRASPRPAIQTHEQPCLADEARAGVGLHKEPGLRSGRELDSYEIAVPPHQ